MEISNTNMQEKYRGFFFLFKKSITFILVRNSYSLSEGFKVFLLIFFFLGWKPTVTAGIVAGICAPLTLNISAQPYYNFVLPMMFEHYIATKIFFYVSKKDVFSCRLKCKY